MKKRYIVLGALAGLMVIGMFAPKNEGKSGASVAGAAASESTVSQEAKTPAIDGIPLTGSAQDAKNLGFTDCSGGASGVHCKSHNFKIFGHTFKEAEIELSGTEKRYTGIRLNYSDDDADALQREFRTWYIIPEYSAAGGFMAVHEAMPVTARDSGSGLKIEPIAIASWNNWMQVANKAAENKKLADEMSGGKTNN